MFLESADPKSTADFTGLSATCKGEVLDHCIVTGTSIIFYDRER